MKRLLLALLAIVCLFGLWTAVQATPDLKFAPTIALPQALGFPNIPRTPGEILSGLNAPSQGRTAIIAYHNGLIFTVPEVPASQPGSDYQVRTWDISNPALPQVVNSYGTTPMPINAHGYFNAGDYLVLGANWPPEAPWSFRALAAPQQVQRTTYPNLNCAGVRGCLFGSWFVGDTWWSYGEVSGNAWISRNGVELSNWDHLGQTGVIGHPFLLGDLLIFASDQSRTGIATYNVANPANPVLLDVLTVGGPGGYWPELWAGDGKLYAVFPYQNGGNGFRVADLTDPSDLKFVTDRPLSGDEAMYAQFQDEFAFIGSHKIDMRTFESVLDLDGANTVRPNDGGIGINTSQFALPVGNLLITGGVGEHQGMAIWAHQAAPDTRGPAITFHIPQAGRANYPVGAPISLIIHETLETKTIVNGTTFIVRPLGGSPIAGEITFAFDDILTFVPTAPLQNNTTYEVVLPAGGIQDAAGNGMVGYSFTFSTGATVGGNAGPAITDFSVSDYPIAPGQILNFLATGSDPDGDPLQYRFDFGDGTPKTNWSNSSSEAHAYGQAGHYRATVQVRDTVSGMIATEALTVTVVTPPVEPRPTHSSAIACDNAGRAVWAVNPDNDSVAMVDADSLTKDLEINVCADPRSLARTAAGEIWVTCHDDDRVRILSAAGVPVASIALGYGSAPAGIAITPNSATAFVALEGRGELVRLDTASRSETGRLALGPTPRAVAISGDGGRVLVTRFISPKDHAEVWDVAAAALTLTRTIRVPKFGNDTNRDGTAGGRGVANYLSAIGISPDGQSAWIAANKPNTERGVLTGPADLDTDNSVRNLAVQISLVNHNFVRAIDLDNSDSASALTFSPLGDYLLVTLQGNNEVQVLDLLVAPDASGLGAFVTRLGTGLAPQGVCIDPTTARTFVHNFMGRSITALETAALFEVGTKNVGATAVATVANETLAPNVLVGKRIFYNAADPRMSAEGYLSCASCHFDGGSDGRVWDFTGRGEGLRRTTILNGRGGMGHGNVHWSANFDEIQDFENDIRLAFGGDGFLSNADFAASQAPLGPAKAGRNADLDALAAYVASLDLNRVERSPFRNSDGTLTAAGLAGRTVFESRNCATCHSGADLTDSTVGAGLLHDVGTLRTTSGGRLGGPLPGIDTPTLRGLFANASFLHDGSAKTLEEVFSVVGGLVIPGETGTPANGAQIVSQYVDLNNDDTARGRAFTELPGAGGRVTFSAIDGGAGGMGAFEIRFSNGGTRLLDVRINGVLRQVQLPNVGNAPTWRHTNWQTIRVENVPWNAGATNTVELQIATGWPNVSVDEIVVATAAHLALAQPHRQVLGLSTTERNNLIAYLRQIDAAADAIGPIFVDGFESGNTSAWSGQVP